ncbi:unnamed protein product (macronuclear) [Paramecium tetraurelia]|uniref:Uncharacterized protein n=1 Tax=Paramecium tetraurelia TaxID=5888 RepID=A0C6H6_PARTE|nr:uncharacterized protein GSPATT00035522001 [Paramecium tetraurelia]CAK66393.1 unnamed protein product [Paramecium tetraurelia]|eukprot:XP_001433790.1 hypothetical protein (macronuclear) [Paramecium tetraurelia strain d4-2]
MQSRDTQYCYYSNFNLFENTSQLIKKEKFIKALLQTLGEEWRIYAGYSISIELDGSINHLAWQFCFEHLLFTWLENEDCQYQEFYEKAILRIQPYKIENAYFRAVFDGFFYSAQQLWSKMKLSRPPSQESFKQVEQIKQEDVRPISNILKPLVLVSEKIINYFKKDEQMRTQEQNQQIQYNQPTWKQISKLTEESLPIDQIENAYLYVMQFMENSYKNCQVAKSFIVNIIELNQDVLGRFYVQNQSVKVRIMQPSSLMYNNLLSIWILANAGVQPQYFDLIGRAKTMLGVNWKDNYQYPLEVFFQLITKLYGNILLNPQIKSDDQLNQLLKSLKVQLAILWDQDIVQQTVQNSQ